MAVEEQKGAVEGTQVFVIKLGDQQVTVPSASAIKAAADVVTAVQSSATLQVVKTNTAMVAKEVEVGVRGFPLAAVNKTDVVGEDYDPYDSEGEHAECFLVNGKVIYDGFCSTYREWHISWRGAMAGLRAKTFEELPKAPTLWQDEGQYYEVMGAVFYDVKKLLQGGALVGILAYFPQISGFALPILKAFIGA